MNTDKLTYDCVYIVDDSKVINLCHFHIVKTMEIANEIQMFCNPIEALKELSEELELPCKSILLLLDIAMEGINGFEFLDSLSPINVKSHLEILIVTDSIDYRNRRKSMRHPLVRSYISKPLSKKKIVNSIKVNK